jgi:glycosidase
MSRGEQAGWQGNRDRARTPMQWDATATAGFAASGVTPWLPVGDNVAVNVAAQRDDPGSVLSLCRDLIRLRKAEFGGQIAAYQALPAPPGVWAYRAGPLTVVGNFSGQPVSHDAPATMLLSTSGPPEPAAGSITLAPWQGVILRA